jgi:hypothetical protein
MSKTIKQIQQRKQQISIPIGSNDEKSHLLSDYLNRKSCYSCISKSCKRKDEHGYSFPTQFCNYVKCPIYIDEIKKAIDDANLLNEFEGKKPFYVICKNIHQECNNCNNLRVKFIDSDRIVLCYSELDPNRDTITVGVHIDLKLIINNNSKFKIVPVPIHIDGEKLIEKYCLNNIDTITDKIYDDNKDNESKMLSELNNENQFIPIEVNNNIIIPSILCEVEIEPELEEIKIQSNGDSTNSLPLEVSENEVNIIEHPSPFNMKNDFPSLTPTKNIGQIYSPINFSKIKEQTEERMLLKEKEEEEARIANNYQKKFSTEITNTLLDDENRKLKKENNILSNRLKECEEKLKTFNFKMETLKEFHKDTNTREYLTKWINNMHLVDNSAIYTLNNTSYKDVKFVKKIYDNEIKFERMIK